MNASSHAAFLFGTVITRQPPPEGPANREQVASVAPTLSGPRREGGIPAKKAPSIRTAEVWTQERVELSHLGRAAQG